MLEQRGRGKGKYEQNASPSARGQQRGCAGRLGATPLDRGGGRLAVLTISGPGTHCTLRNAFLRWRRVTLPAEPKRFFKGCAKPGPLLPMDREVPSVDEGETLDALCGDLRLYQLKNGHRFSTDDILTAWYGTTWCPTARTILDLGNGIGTVATIAA
jgi:hypothetical protein